VSRVLPRFLRELTAWKIQGEASEVFLLITDFLVLRKADFEIAIGLDATARRQSKLILHLQ